MKRMPDPEQVFETCSIPAHGIRLAAAHGYRSPNCPPVDQEEEAASDEAEESQNDLATSCSAGSPDAACLRSDARLPSASFLRLPLTESDALVVSLASSVVQLVAGSIRSALQVEFEVPPAASLQELVASSSFDWGSLSMLMVVDEELSGELSSEEPPHPEIRTTASRRTAGAVARRSPMLPPFWRLDGERRLQ